MNLTALLISFGPFALVVVGAMVFVENGLLFPFLPGDSLIFAAAVLGAALGVPWPIVVAVAAVCAIGGAEVGFVLGRRYGRRLFRDDARVLTTRRLAETERFFDRWGRWAIVLARFVPIVRTYISPAAGSSAMRHRTFSIWNAAGGVAWALILGVAGALLGSIPWVASNIEWIMLALVVASVAPIVVTTVIRRRARRAEQESGPVLEPEATRS
jgi:membrane-associated protein